MAVAAIAAQLRGGQRQHRAQALAAGIDQMPGKLGDQFDIRPGAVEDDAVDMSHVLLDKRNQRREARSWIFRAGKLNHYSQETFSYYRPQGMFGAILSAVCRQGQGAAAAHEGSGQAMKELLRSNDPVLLSYVSALLEEGDIAFMVADTNMSVLEGSIGVLPRRVLVESDEDWRERATSSPRPDRPCHRRRQESLSVRQVADRRHQHDDFLGGRISVVQPGRAIAREAMPCCCRSGAGKAGERVLDIGAGVGVAGLCLVARLPGIAVTAVEIDPGLCALAAQNAGGTALPKGSKSSTPM